MRVDFHFSPRGALPRESWSLLDRIRRPRRSVPRLSPEIFSRPFVALRRSPVYPWIGPLLAARSGSSRKKLLRLLHVFPLLLLWLRQLRCWSVGLEASCRWAQT